MSQVDIIDLDEIAGPPKQVRVGGQVYKLPADIPVDLYLRLKQAAQDEDSSPEADEAFIEALYDELLDLFRIYQPEVDRLPISMTALTQAVPRLYGGLEDVPENPPKPARSTRSSSRRKSAAGTK